MKYLIIDTANTFFRARHAASRHADAWDKLGFAIHVTIGAIAKCWREQQADHVVFCLEGKSWRKEFYAPYKKNRAVARAALTEEQQEEDKLFWETFDELTKYIKESSNCTVLQHPNLEADDLVAGWIQAHPHDEHVIVSSDSDFHQLLSENVKQYNGIADELHTLQGIFDKKGAAVIDKKTKLPKTIPNPQWILFEKCMRGDSSDNVFSAYPGVRTKGTKNKVGLMEAYQDKENKGFNWNNLMNQTWTDHKGEEHKVVNDYERNVTLVDLTAQPVHVKVMIAETIAENSTTKEVGQVGTKFLKFCGKYEMVKMTDSPKQYVDFLSASYPEVEATANTLRNV
jgi:5'-3' exonuclease